MRINNNSTIVSLTSLINGLKKNQPKAVFLLSETKYTTAQLVTIMQSIITSLQAVTPAQGAYLRASRAAATLQTQNRAALRDLKQFLQIQSGGNTELLSQYGLKPRKQGGATTPEEKVAGANAAKATRVARHTMGKKQKKSITGATAPAAPASAPTAISGNPALQTAVVPVIPGH
jgi:hypothetical protein